MNITDIKTIDARAMRLMILNAAATIENNCTKLNDLNVFPVPDGDTGSNMALTVSAAARELANGKRESAGEIANIAAKAMLRGARGNSGVITSLLFRGIATELTGLDTCNAEALSNALQSGVAAAYKAVSNPAEGTILTVSRLAADAAVKAAQSGSIMFVFDKAIEAAKEALSQTTEMNPVLKKAGVVDAGGFGWVLILEAMKDAVCGNEIKSSVDFTAQASESADFSSFDSEDITFAYCTEFIVSRTNTNDPANLKAELEKLGDSLVVVDDEEIIKVHVHTNDPGSALHLAIEYGQFISVKVENMKLQHSNKIAEDLSGASPVAEYGVVAVSPGEGITEVFGELGVDECVSGGQTMNPSTDDILAAIEKVSAKNIFVLPNNKNIILAAEQACEISDKNVIVIPSKTVPQGICAMQAYDTDLSIDEIKDTMTESLSNVTTMQMTTAVRDSNMNGLDIKKDDFIALCEGELMAGGKDEAVLIDMLISKIKETDRDIITVYFGCDVSEEEAVEMSARFEEAFGEDNVSLVPGGQSVYRYIVSAEI
ncbi:MAG: DAK2 domain-containing protein [Ruminococcaceae bacterium]|nr:DAK2 domain-containing protein [Oscillospiraceae bacterium]